MYAIVDVAGQQFKVEKEQKIFIHRLESEIGSQIDFDKVLLIDNDSSVVVGNPLIEGAMVTVKVLGHLKGDKVIIFKKKKKKGYKVKNGHRQLFTHVLVEDIIEKGGKPRPFVKAKKSVVSAPEAKIEKPVREPAPVITEAPAESKKTSPVTKQPAAKKTAAKKPAATKKPEATKASASEKIKKTQTEIKAGTKSTIKKATAKKPSEKAKKPVEKKDSKPVASKNPAKATGKEKK